MTLWSMVDVLSSQTQIDLMVPQPLNVRQSLSKIRLLVELVRNSVPSPKYRLPLLGAGTSISRGMAAWPLPPPCQSCFEDPYSVHPSRLYPAQASGISVTKSIIARSIV